MTEADSPQKPAPFEKALDVASTEVGVFTKQASTVARTTALAGIGIVWLYADRGSADNKLTVAISSLAGQWWLLAALSLFIVSLTFDIFQYLYASWRWQQFEEVTAVISTYDDFEPGFPSASVKRAWSKRVGLDLAAHIVIGAKFFLPKVKYQSLPEFHYAAVARAREILSILYSSEHEGTSGHSKSNEDLSGEALAQLEQHVELSWAPERIATVTDRFFWSKMFCVAGGFVCLLVTIALAIIHHICGS